MVVSVKTAVRQKVNFYYIFSKRVLGIFMNPFFFSPNQINSNLQFSPSKEKSKNNICTFAQMFVCLIYEK